MMARRANTHFVPGQHDLVRCRVRDLNPRPSVYKSDGNCYFAVGCNVCSRFVGALLAVGAEIEHLNPKAGTALDGQCQAERARSDVDF